jgi:hypothetical protein
MEVIMLEDNESMQPSDLPGPIPDKVETLANDSPVSEAFRTVRHGAEEFGTVPHASERRENHTLTVREVARMFEVAGVARTERSIGNWCQRNAPGAAKLDAYFDPNERKYFITAPSVELAIAEERAKAAKANTVSESVGNLLNSSKKLHDTQAKDSETDGDTIISLEREIRDLQITNRAKDMYVEQLRQERDGFFGQLLDASHKLGKLETKLLLLQGRGAVETSEEKNAEEEGVVGL